MDAPTEKVLTLLDRLDLASSEAKRAATIERQRHEELQRHCVHALVGEERYEHREFAGYHAPRLICLVCGIEHQSDAEGALRNKRTANNCYIASLAELRSLVGSRVIRVMLRENLALAESGPLLGSRVAADVSR